MVSSNIRAPACSAGGDRAGQIGSVPRQARGGVVGALAHSDRTALGWHDEAAPGRPRLSPARRVRPTERRQAGWNVLAQELVAFPPAAELTAGRQRHRAVHRPELVKDAHAVSNNADRTRLAGSTTTWEDVYKRQPRERPRGPRWRARPEGYAIAVRAARYRPAGDRRDNLRLMDDLSSQVGLSLIHI